MSMSMSYPGSEPTVRRVSIKAIRDQEDAREVTSRVNVGDVERWASGIAGGLLMVHGLRRGSFGGLALAVLGGRGVSRGHRALPGVRGAEDRHLGQAPRRLRRARLQGRPRQAHDDDPPDADGDLRLRQGPGEPPPLHGERSVGPRRPGRDVPLGDDGAVRLDLEVPVAAHQRGARRLVAWKTLPGGDLEIAGTIRLEPAFDGRGTEVTMEISFEPPAGSVGLAVAKALGHDPDATVRGNLGRLKGLLEGGEGPVA